MKVHSLLKDTPICLQYSRCGSTRENIFLAAVMCQFGTA
jgi:hypothetical protein